MNRLNQNWHFSDTAQPQYRYSFPIVKGSQDRITHMCIRQPYLFYRRSSFLLDKITSYDNLAIVIRLERPKKQTCKS